MHRNPDVERDAATAGIEDGASVKISVSFLVVVHSPPKENAYAEPEPRPVREEAS